MNAPPEAPYDGYHKYDSRIARSYESDRKVEAHWWKEDEFIRHFLSGKAVRHLLDLPVGTGRFLPHYAEATQVTGIDISEAMLAEARTRIGTLGYEHAAVEHGDVFKLRFNDGQFDLIIVSRLFHLIPPDMLPAAVKELCRVASGELLVQTYNPRRVSPRLRTRIRAAITRRLRRLIALGRQESSPQESSQQASTPWAHIQAFTHDQAVIDSLFAASGFVVADKRIIDLYLDREVRMTVFRKTARV